MVRLEGALGEEPVSSRSWPIGDGAASFLAVSIVIQHLRELGSLDYTLSRSAHRVPAGTTIRQLLQALELQGHVGLVHEVEHRLRGLSRHGRRAWLDDPLQPDDRIDLMLPILSDARQARFERVARTRRERKWHTARKR
ncbi:MAG: RnfH family protein [Lautropia sp.]|nr:RnfH family protein [Lautropia sp.]